MDTQIFNLGLSIHATSAYIVICSIVSDGLPASLGNLTVRWMAAPELLTGALEELTAWLVIEPVIDKDGERLFAPNPASIWRPPASPPRL
jgi:hypothetical protein